MTSIGPQSWRPLILKSGSILFRHPTYEQLLSESQKITMLQQKHYKEQLAEKHPELKALPSYQSKNRFTRFLNADQISEARKLYREDPFENSIDFLAKRYMVHPFVVKQVLTKEHELVVKHRQRLQRENYKIRTLRSSKQKIRRKMRRAPNLETRKVLEEHAQIPPSER
eukprot:CAMPEP_0117449878 /NCGR_PEP_ID=MMETSP0759-20121206/8174_1 /TAXON_ID=63605 /ORGANISM="Percolomonas cosmopolitus, Strain WS" /LENGTH=168 /DNA_ID=CAMNT_0005242371 /DNA_START=155 /DNA_END=658 /DNA_ORIENTATION=-